MWPEDDILRYRRVTAPRPTVAELMMQTGLAPVVQPPTATFPGQPGETQIFGALPEFGGQVRSRRVLPQNWQSLAPKGEGWLSPEGFGGPGEWFEAQWAAANANMGKRRPAGVDPQRGFLAALQQQQQQAVAPNPPAVAAPPPTAHPMLPEPGSPPAIDPTVVGTPPYVPTTRPRTTNTPVGPSSPVRMGTEVPAGASRLEELMAQRAALSQADPGSKVRRTPWGYDIAPPEQSPSRVRHAGMGAAQGAIIAGQASQGDPWATLAGTAVGALTGGVSPALIQAFTRRQELDQSAGDLSTEQKLQLQNAQIGETLAQAEQRRIQPLIEAEKLRQQAELEESRETGRNRRAELGARTRVQTAAEADKLRRESLEERKRHNKVIEAKPSGGPMEEIEVAGRKFQVSANTAARILEARTTGRADKTTEARIEAELEEEAANDHLSKRRDAETRASTLRAERDRLSASPVTARANADRIKELDRQIAQEETEARYRQSEADNSFGRARKAKAKGGTTGQPASGSGRTIEGAIEAFRQSQKREPTAEEIARMRAALKRG